MDTRRDRVDRVQSAMRLKQTNSAWSRLSLEQDENIHRDAELYKDLFLGALDGVVLWNNDYEIVDINPAGEKLFHASKNEIIGLSLLEVLALNKISDEIIKNKRQEHEYLGDTDGVIVFGQKNGEKIYIEYSTKKNILVNLNLTRFRDISDKVKLEEQLRKSDTLNVVGQLAAGIAHEIRNPMTSLKGFIQLLEDTTKEDHSLYFDVIKMELNRIDSIVNEFLILAKPQVINYVEKDIVQLMRETMELLKPQAVLHNVQFQFEAVGKIPAIICEPNQLKKVFINLIKNAIEVMPNGGFVTIEMKNIDINSILISIKDEGEGIPQEKVERLGEPFFTTKDKGTGLGLMVSYQIVKEHEGCIEIESEVGKGTTFFIKLPVKKG